MCCSLDWARGHSLSPYGCGSPGQHPAATQPQHSGFVCGSPFVVSHPLNRSRAEIRDLRVCFPITALGGTLGREAESFSQNSHGSSQHRVGAEWCSSQLLLGTWSGHRAGKASQNTAVPHHLSLTHPSAPAEEPSFSEHHPGIRPCLLFCSTVQNYRITDCQYFLQLQLPASRVSAQNSSSHQKAKKPPVPPSCSKPENCSIVLQLVSCLSLSFSESII